MGLPGKLKGFDGAEVERHYREGKITVGCSALLQGSSAACSRFSLLADRRFVARHALLPRPGSPLRRGIYFPPPGLSYSARRNSAVEGHRSVNPVTK